MSYKALFIYIGVLLILSPFIDNSTAEDVTDNNPPYAGADGHQIKLINNENATNVTYAELVSFIIGDLTDKKKYVPREYTCGDYAETLHNRAEKRGIKAAWVAVDFESDPERHACNAFYTTDKGLIFIDCVESDAWVECKIGKTYKLHSLKNGYYYRDDMGIVSNIEIYW